MHLNRFQKIVIAIVFIAAFGTAAALPISQQKPAEKYNPQLCHVTAKYIVIEKSHAPNVGTDFLIKYKTKPSDILSCKYITDKNDFEIKNDEANYFLAIQKDLLILDQGTGPDRRNLIIWDLKKRAKVFSSPYSEPWEIKPNHMIFWTETGKANNRNCPSLKKWAANGMEGAIETRVKLNLANLQVTKSSKTRCQIRQ